MREGGVSVICADSEHALALTQSPPNRVITYALDHEADYTALNLKHNAKGCYGFLIRRGDTILGHVQLSVPGRHNAQNALGVFAAAMELGVPIEDALRSLGDFSGVHRRFEHTGDSHGVTLYHDYGHNPAEYRSVIPIAAMLPHRKLYVVCQPHTYSRLKRLFDQFLTAFDGADEVLITDIYAAREKDPGDIHSTMLVDALKKNGVPVVYCPGFADCKQYLYDNWQPGDVVLTLGCGNINLLNEML
jgi:UDP-N-acetylmuramate--alanine ligase